MRVARLLLAAALLAPGVADAQQPRPRARSSVAQRYPKVSTTVVGDTALLAVQVDGQPVAVPTLRVELVVPTAIALPRGNGPANLSAPGPRGWSASDRPIFRAAVDGPAPLGWTLVISRLDAGMPVPVQSIHGTGAPGDITWDGLGDDGKPVARGAVLVAQLRVRLDGNAEVASPRLGLGIAFGEPPAAARKETLRGELFTGKPVKATPALTRQAAALAKRLGGESLEIEVHSDGTGDKLARLAETQKQAEAAKQAFVAAGVPAERIKARGRGSLDPLVKGQGRAARNKNRRVEIVVAAAAGPVTAEVPAPSPGRADALVAGQLAPVDAGGRFVKNVATPADGRLLVDLLGADGRRATFWLSVAPATRPGPRVVSSKQAKRIISGDVAAGTLAVDGAPLDTALLGLDVGLDGDPVVKTGRAGLSRPLAFTTSVPPGLGVSRWRLEVREGSTLVHTLSGEGAPPASLAWDGTVDGKPRLQRGRRYTYRLVVDAARGDRGWSADRGFAVAPVAASAAATTLAGGQFDRKGEPGGRLRNALSRAVARGGRFRVEIVVPAGASATDARLRAAARAAKVRAYVGKLGGGEGRAEVVSRVVPGDAPRGEQRERVVVTPVNAAPARAVVLGAPVPLEGSKFSVDVVVPAGAALPVEMVRPTGQRAVWTVAAAGAARARWDDDNLEDWTGDVAAAGDPGEEGLMPLWVQVALTVEPTGDEGLLPAHERQVLTVEPSGDEGLLPPAGPASVPLSADPGDGLLPPEGVATQVDDDGPDALL